MRRKRKNQKRQRKARKDEDIPTEVLSQDEIDQLLTAINAGDTEPEDFRPRADTRKIKIYDFKRPDKFSKEQIRTIAIIHEAFARMETALFSSLFRQSVHVHVASVDQLTYEEFIRSLPTPTTLAVINMNPLGGNAILEIDPTITHTMINLLFGGQGGPLHQHELTDLEKIVMEDVVIRSLLNLREAWTSITDLRPRLGQIDTNPQFIQIVPPTEMVVLVTLETQVGDAEGMMNLCIPQITLDSIMDKLTAKFWYSKIATVSSPNRINVQEIEVSLTAELFRKNFTYREIIDWEVGSIIYPIRETNMYECFLKVEPYILFEGIVQSEPEKPMYAKKIKILRRVEPYKERIVENNSNPIGLALEDANIEISVELGRTKKLVKEILCMGEGTIVELDKLAGEPVDIFANNVRIAKGEVVVIDENFGVRVTEICNERGISFDDTIL